MFDGIALVTLRAGWNLLKADFAAFDKAVSAGRFDSASVTDWFNELSSADVQFSDVYSPDLFRLPSVYVGVESTRPDHEFMGAYLDDDDEMTSICRETITIDVHHPNTWLARCLSDCMHSLMRTQTDEFARVACPGLQFEGASTVTTIVEIAHPVVRAQTRKQKWSALVRYSGQVVSPFAILPHIVAASDATVGGQPGQFTVTSS